MLKFNKTLSTAVATVRWCVLGRWGARDTAGRPNLAQNCGVCQTGFTYSASCVKKNTWYHGQEGADAPTKGIDIDHPTIGQHSQTTGRNYHAITR